MLHGGRVDPTVDRYKMSKLLSSFLLTQCNLANSSGLNPFSVTGARNFTVPDKNNLRVTRESRKFQCVFSRNRIYGSTRKISVLMFYHFTCNKVSQVI